MTQWLNRRGRLYWYDQYALNDQAVAFAKYDPDRIADELAATGADVIALYAAIQFSVAYYPSQIWPQHPNLHGRDYFGEVLERLRRRGKKVIAYINWLESRHPEWNMIPLGRENDPTLKEMPLAAWADPADPERRVQNVPGGQWRVPCINSPRRDQVIAVACEILDRYHPDAFHLDMFVNDGICVCPYCKPTLERICAQTDITREAIAAHWREYIDWKCERSASLLADLSREVRARGVVAAHNAFAPMSLSPNFGVDEQWLDSLDMFLSECFDAFLVPSTDLNATSINVRWQHAVGKPSAILRTSAQIHYSHWPLTEAQWQVCGAACKANGAKLFGPCGVGAYPDTTSSKHLLESVKKGFDFYMKDADLDEAATSAAKIALVFSWATRKYHGNGQDMRWCEEFAGWARLLIEEHLPYNIVVAERVVSAADLACYDLVILPNSATLDAIFCQAVRDYAAQGGLVLATAETSCFDRKGNLLPTPGLADVLGITRVGAVEGPFAIERSIEPEPASGLFQQVRSRGKVLVRHIAVDPAGSVAGTKDPMPLAPSEWPVVTANGFGRGRSAYIAFDIGRFFELHGDTHIGKLIVETVDALLPSRQVTVTAPRTVEVTVWRQEALNRTIIHLANRTVAWTLPTDARQIAEILPVHDIELCLEAPGAAVRVSGRDVAVEVCEQGLRLALRVPRLEAYGAVVIEPEEAAR
ncbi:MAG: beta-galactosidase trimerization domain-containing protein [Candidatus Hydrogenedentes bacterium]|nr:beta-galactosidase trimerization domain-containing protein [Candidatus Hydrogenedentota bacterium]